MYHRNHHKRELHKKLRGWLNELRELQNLPRENKGYLIPVKPFQEGWYRTFVLRDDATRRSDAHILKKVLDIVNNRVFCRKKDFLYYDWKEHKHLPIEQKLNSISEREYEKLDEQLKSYFYRYIEIQRFRYQLQEKITYKVRKPVFFVYKIYPRMITHRWIPDSEYESRRNYLWNKLYVQYEKELRELKHLRNDHWRGYIKKLKYSLSYDDKRDIEQLGDKRYGKRASRQNFKKY